MKFVWAPADTHVDAADEHDSAGKKAPEKQIEFGSLRLNILEFEEQNCALVINIKSIITEGSREQFCSLGLCRKMIKIMTINFFKIINK